MKDILLKLANGENIFDCKIFGENRTCKILKLDLGGLDENKGRAFVRFEVPIKKIIRKENTETILGLDLNNSLLMEDVEVDSYEEWISIGY